MVPLSFAGAAARMAVALSDVNFYRFVGDDYRLARCHLSSMGIYWTNDWWLEPLVGSGYCPPTRGFCRLYTETLSPLSLVELALLDWGEWPG